MKELMVAIAAGAAAVRWPPEQQFCRAVAPCWRSCLGGDGPE